MQFIRKDLDCNGILSSLVFIYLIYYTYYVYIVCLKFKVLTALNEPVTKL